MPEFTTSTGAANLNHPISSESDIAKPCNGTAGDTQPDDDDDCDDDDDSECDCLSISSVESNEDELAFDLKLDDEDDLPAQCGACFMFTYGSYKAV